MFNRLLNTPLVAVENVDFYPYLLISGMIYQLKYSCLLVAPCCSEADLELCQAFRAFCVKLLMAESLLVNEIELGSSD